MPSTTLIDEFIATYARERDYYARVAEIARARLEMLLGEQGVRAIVTGRAKSVERLREKLEQRGAARHCATFQDIRSDIVDLAGVRVALYFPGDRVRVNALIRDTFDINVERQFPLVDPAKGSAKWQKRFSGYAATHHRGSLRAEHVGADAHYMQATIEIQVGSVLMHAWAEVEHDLLYKPATGELSMDEHAILDEVNGLVLAGEIALERLQAAAERRISASRVPLRTTYDVSALLVEYARSHFELELSDTTLGRADLLLMLLRRLGLDKAEDLRRYLESIDHDVEKRPIAEQVIDQIVAGDPERVAIFETIQRSGTEAHNQRFQDIGEFVRWWTLLESALLTGTSPTVPHMMNIRDRVADLFDAQHSRRFERLRHLRNQAVHRPTKDLDGLRRASHEVKELLNELATNAKDPEVKAAARRALDEG